MPFPIVPPPSTDIGALTCPRTLQKWLDVNNATRLTRVSTYITMPSFVVTSSWNGYSDIVTTFNFEGPSNFSLKIVPTEQNQNAVVLVTPTRTGYILDNGSNVILNQGNGPIVVNS